MEILETNDGAPWARALGDRRPDQTAPDPTPTRLEDMNSNSHALTPKVTVLLAVRGVKQPIYLALKSET